MNYTIIDRTDKDVIDEQFINDFSSYSGQPSDGIEFFLHAALELIEQCLDISLTPMTIKVNIPSSRHTVILPFRNACDIIDCKMISCEGYEYDFHPKNLRLVCGKLFMPVNDNSWVITYSTEPFNMDVSTKLAVFKVAEMMVEGENCSDHSMIRKMLKQYDIQIGSLSIPH